MKKSTTLLLLIVILSVAIFFRFFSLNKQDFISWDEGMYMNEAVFYQSLIHNIPLFIEKTINKTLVKDDFIENIDGWPPSSAKPMHGFLIYLISLFLGMNLYAAKFLSALFGIFSIIMIYLIMRMFYGELIGIISALFEQYLR